jgi:hypothetical protein
MHVSAALNLFDLARDSYPTVRLSNFMKALTSDGVQDPTHVEARVRREVAMTKHTHEKTNAERKLTEQRRNLSRRRKVSLRLVVSIEVDFDLRLFVQQG